MGGAQSAIRNALAGKQGTATSESNKIKSLLSNDDLPALEGTERQIAWAENIRLGYIESQNALYEAYNKGIEKGYDKLTSDEIDKITDIEKSNDITKWKDYRQQIREIEFKENDDGGRYDIRTLTSIEKRKLKRQGMDATEIKEKYSYLTDPNKSITHYVSDIQKYQKDFIKSKRSADWWIDNMRAYGGRR